MANALNAAGALTVGAERSDGASFYRIGYDRASVEPDEIRVVLFQKASKEDTQPWRFQGAEADSYDAGPGLWAEITPVSDPPEPVTIGGSVTGLTGKNLVLQNNGRDDEIIQGDGDFTFDTALAPGDPYSVTVKTQPSNPAQTCSVENGSGTVSDEDVTNVAVTYVEDEGPNVITDGDGNVTRIENLPVVDETTEETTIYNVDFRYESAIDVYGSGLDFDFPAPENDENIFVALAAVNNTLNRNDPIPVVAGPQGSDQFFIGYTEEEGLIVATGSEVFAGVWGPCGTDPCIGFDELQTGAAVLNPNNSFTWADFTVAE